MRAEVRLHVDVAAHPDAVWGWVGDWDRQRMWMPLTRVRHRDGPALAVGTRVVARTGLGPVAFDDLMTVTSVEDEPGGARWYEVLHTGRVVRGVGLFRVEPRPAGTARFVWWERVEVPGGALAPALWAVGGPATRLAFGWALRRFARAVANNPDRLRPAVR